MSPRTPHRIRDATSHRWRRKESVNKSYTTVEELEAERGTADGKRSMARLR